MHALLFVTLAMLGRAAGWRPLPLGVALVAYAALTKVLQASLPIGRDGDLVDLAADTVGTVLGLVAFAVLSRARRAAPYPDRRRG